MLNLPDAYRCVQPRLLLIVVLLPAISTLEAGPSPTGRWEALPSLPTPRHDLELVAVKGKLYAISGSGDTTYQVVEVYDPVRGVWSTATPIPDGRGWFGAAVIGGHIYCVGGKRVRSKQEKAESGNDQHYEFRNSLNIYDPANDRWVVGPPMPTARAGCRAAAVDGRLYVIGGNRPDKGFLDCVEVYDTRTKTWQAGPPLPEGRQALGVAAVGGKVYAIGGVHHTVRSDVFILDPKVGRWTTGAAMPTPRRSLAVAVHGPRVWCIGGVGAKGYVSTVEVYDTRTDRWTTGPDHPQGKSWMGACLFDRCVYVAGGANYDDKNKRYNWLDEFHVLVPDPAAGAAEDEIAVTWWGCMSVEVSFGRRTLVFDPYVRPDLPRIDYVFLSHSHYDHCHEPTLRRLLGPLASRLQLLVGARGCFHASRVDGPNNFSDTPLSDLAFVPRGKCVAMTPALHEDRGPRPEGLTELTHGRLRILAIQSHEDPRPLLDALKRDPSLAGPWPNLGYVVTDARTGFTVMHVGDLWRAYPQMRKLRGKVDVLFYPLGKLALNLKKQMMDYIRPKIAVPTHYRLFEDDFPIPANFDRALTTKELYANPGLLKRACLGHWYPSPTDPVAEIADQRKQLAPFTRVVELKAGQRYVLPKDLAAFQGVTREQQTRD